MKNRTALLIISLILIVQAGDLNLGGYLKNSSTAMIDRGESEMFTDVAELRLEGAWEWEKGGMEVHLLGTKTFRPIIPFFEVYRENSLMMDMTYDFIGAYMGLITPQMDSLVEEITGEEMDGILTDEQIEELIKLGEQLPYSSFYPSTMINLDRALIKLYLPFMDIFVGRQPIAWGTGYAFNPTDLWNLKNPTDAEAPKMGLNALRLEIPLGDLAGLSLVASPGREFKESSGGFRLKWNLAGFDMSVSGISLMNADRDMFYLKRKVVAGTDLAGQIGDVGVWYEAAVSNRIYDSYTNFDSLFTQIDIGADYTFSNGLYIMSEYLFNSLGKESWRDYTIYDMAAVAGGEAPGMGKHYLFGGVSQELQGQLILACYGLSNVQEKSGMVMPQATYTFNDNIEIQLKGTVAVGDKETTEFGSMKSSVQMRFTGFF